MSDDFIFIYTAEDGMRDGTLFDVSELAREVGFTWTVRITVGVQQLVTPDEAAKKYGQSYTGRLWDVLIVAAVAIKISDDDRLVEFKVDFQDGPNKHYSKKLWAAPDFTSGRAIHILLPSEY